MREAMKVFTSLSNYPGQTLKASINSIICSGWKVYGEKKVNCINAWDFSNWQTDVNDDSQLVKAMHEILSQADAIVTHNGKRFDWKFFQTRLMINGLKPLPKIKHIDTCQAVRSNLMLFNNKLDTVATTLTSEAKLKTGGWDLWVKVAERDKPSMDKMTKYCKQDVKLLEPVFDKLKPFIKSIPNYSLFKGEDVCPSCGSDQLTRWGYRFAEKKRYQRLMCQKCGSESRGGQV